MSDRLNIVSSSHLVSEKCATLSEFEYALTMVNNAFQRWMQSCCIASELQDLSSLDILVLHNLHHRNRAKRTSDVAFMLNIEDHHTVAYSVRKLLKKELVSAARKGKDTYYQVNEQGQSFCERYRQIREECLIEVVAELNIEGKYSEVAALMRNMSGVYDQASRAVRSL
jgi:predicted MarR family transcription regulator